MSAGICFLRHQPHLSWRGQNINPHVGYLMRRWFVSWQIMGTRKDGVCKPICSSNGGEMSSRRQEFARTKKKH